MSGHRTRTGTRLTPLVRLLRLSVIVIWGVAISLAGSWWAETGLAGGGRGEGPIRLELGYNPGVAFSIGTDQSVGVVATLTSLVVLGVLGLAWRAGRRSVIEAMGWSMVAAGGLANLLDRLEDGTVTDYVHVWAWPAFNVADAVIVVGVGLVLLAFAVQASFERRLDR